MRILRIATLCILAVFFLTGCLKTEGLLQRDPTANQYYKLDTQELRVCRGETSRCYALAPIASARTVLRPFEEKYGKRVASPNYPVNFARMLLNPPDNSYTPERIGEGRFYHLPINDYTDTAWTTLEAVYKAYYDN